MTETREPYKIRIRVTRKLALAAEVLECEHIADLHPGTVVRLMWQGRVTRGMVYKAVERFGYRWNGRGWARPLPGWLWKAGSDVC
jgi:hypothetical protein